MSNSRPPLPSGWAIVLHEAYNHTCPMCLEGRKTAHIDHINSWSRVKEHKLENLIPLCAKCNLLKSDNEFVPELTQVLININRAHLAEVKSRIMSREKFLLPNGEELEIELEATTRWSLPDTIRLVRNFVKHGQACLAKLARELNRSVRSLISRLATGLKIYKKVSEAHGFVTT